MSEAQYNRLIRRLEALEARDGVLAAEFVDTAAAPGDDLRVIAYGWDDGEHTFGPVRWSPIGGALPEAGDECMIVERDDGQWSVAGWWSSSQGTGVAQGTIDSLDARLDALEIVSDARGQVTATGTGVSFADVVVTDNLGTTTKRGGAWEHVGGTFTGDATFVRVLSTGTNTTTLRAITRLGGNIPVGQTVLVDYHVWR